MITIGYYLYRDDSYANIPIQGRIKIRAPFYSFFSLIFAWFFVLVEQIIFMFALFNCAHIHNFLSIKYIINQCWIQPLISFYFHLGHFLLKISSQTSPKKFYILPTLVLKYPQLPQRLFISRLVNIPLFIFYHPIHLISCTGWIFLFCGIFFHFFPFFFHFFSN